MKRLIVAAFVALTITGAGTAGAAPHRHLAKSGSTVTYEYRSDTVRNDITYYGRDGKLVTRLARFSPLPIGFSREQYGYTIQFRALKNQPVGTELMSGEQYATCKVTVNGRQIDYRRELLTGVARC